MNEKNVFKGVEDTLYIPLTARIYASKKFPKFFYDENSSIFREIYSGKRYR